MMSRRLLSILILAVLVFPSIYLIASVKAEATDTTKLNPIADSYVEEINPSSNYGGKSYLYVADSTNPFVGVQIAYIMFDLSDIPTDATIDSALLQLHTSIYVTETHRIGAHYCSDNSWKEYEINWNNKPSFSAEAIETVAVAKTDTWYNWTVTSCMQTALQGGKLTLVIKSEDQHETAWVDFHSRDQEYSWMEKYRPKLVVSWTPPVTPPTEALSAEEAVLALGILAVIGFFGYRYFKRKTQPPSVSPPPPRKKPALTPPPAPPPSVKAPKPKVKREVRRRPVVLERRYPVAIGVGLLAATLISQSLFNWVVIEPQTYTVTVDYETLEKKSHFLLNVHWFIRSGSGSLWEAKIGLNKDDIATLTMTVVKCIPGSEEANYATLTIIDPRARTIFTKEIHGYSFSSGGISWMANEAGDYLIRIENTRDTYWSKCGYIKVVKYWFETVTKQERWGIEINVPTYPADRYIAPQYRAAIAIALAIAGATTLIYGMLVPPKKKTEETLDRYLITENKS